MSAHTALRGLMRKDGHVARISERMSCNASLCEAKVKG